MAVGVRVNDGRRELELRRLVMGEFAQDPGDVVLMALKKLGLIELRQGCPSSSSRQKTRRLLVDFPSRKSAISPAFRLEFSLSGC